MLIGYIWSIKLHPSTNRQRGEVLVQRLIFSNRFKICFGITVLIESAYYVPVPEITAFGFEETGYLGVSIDRLGRITYAATIPRNMPDSYKIKPPVILVGENLNYATGDDCQIALLTSSGLVVTSCIVNIESATYDVEKGCWTTKNLELPKIAGTYKLAYSNDGGETWTQIGYSLTIEISVD